MHKDLGNVSLHVDKSHHIFLGSVASLTSVASLDSSASLLKISNLTIRPNMSTHIGAIGL